MASPRSDAGISLTASSSMMTDPLVMSSSPAMIRNKVDLPQPDGPTKTQNSPASTVRSTPWMTSTSP